MEEDGEGHEEVVLKDTSFSWGQVEGQQGLGCSEKQQKSFSEDDQVTPRGEKSVCTN